MKRGWNSVNETLPEDGERVLVWLAFVNDFDLATYIKDQGSWIIEGQFKGNNSQITHWKRVDTSKINDPNRPAKGMMRILVPDVFEQDIPIEIFPEVVTFLAEKSGDKESDLYMRLIRQFLDEE